MKITLFYLCSLMLTLTACDAPHREAESPALPGFTDAPPPPPRSDTVILSGGVLVAEQDLPDSVIVIANGKLLRWGARGSVAVPNDSVGRDLRGFWLQARALEPHAPADILIYDRDPRVDSQATPVGRIQRDMINLPPSANP